MTTKLAHLKIANLVEKTCLWDSFCMGLIFQGGLQLTCNLTWEGGGGCRWKGKWNWVLRWTWISSLTFELQLGNDLDLDKEVVARHVWQGGAY